MIRSLVATVLLGLRSRALLTAGSLLLTSLAVGSAVLGPIFQVAATNSYLVTRLAEAPNPLTGLTWRYTPDPSYVGRAEAARDQAASVADARETGPFAPADAQLVTEQFDALKGRARLLAREEACDHLEIEGRCPTSPDEVLVLVGDLDFGGIDVGDRIDLGAVGEKTVVGGYRLPESQSDFWFDPQRLTSVPRTFNEFTGAVTPYQPAPLITTPDAFDPLPVSSWEVLVDRRLDVPPDTTRADLDAAISVAARVQEQGPAQVAGGTIVGDTINDLSAVDAETRREQAIARASIAPAVISLVLVALALLMRLLSAAAELRLPELALAALRGLPRSGMWGLGLSEPVAVLVIALPVGAVTGVALALGLVRWWLVPGLPLPLPVASVVSGLAVVVAAFLVAVLAVALVLRVSLSEQLTGVRRPKASGRTAIIIQLVLVATAVAVLVSKLSGGPPGQPDVTDLLLPVLLAVVAGLAATRATALLATWWTRRRRRTRSLPSFVAARAISRRQEGTLIILPVTVAIAVCVFGAGVYDSAASWRLSVAATTAPAAEVWLSPQQMDETVALTHELDPGGEHLMAATTVGTLGPTYAVLDTPRLASVAEWQDQWTPGIGPEEIADALAPRADIPTVAGRDLALTVDNRAETDEELHVRVRLAVPGDRPHFVFLGPFPPGESARSGGMPYCRDGCSITGLTLGGPAALPLQISGRVEIRDISVDGEQVPGAVDGAGWAASASASAADMITAVESEGEVLAVETSSGGSNVIVQLTSGDLPSALPVVRGVDAPSAADKGSFGATTSAMEFATDPVVMGESVPLLGPTGVMIDYTMLTTEREIYAQDFPVYVFVASDTPPDLREALLDSGASISTTLASTQRTLDQGAYALALRLYAVVALLVLLMALAGLFVNTAVQLPARRRDAASLRIVGVPRRAVMSAVLRELGVVLGSTPVAGLAAGTLAQYVVLRTVTLGVVDNVKTPALVAAVDWQRLVLLAAASALVFGVVAVVSAVLTVRGARGSTLRESAR